MACEQAKSRNQDKVKNPLFMNHSTSTRRRWAVVATVAAATAVATAVATAAAARAAVVTAAVTAGEGMAAAEMAAAETALY